MKTQQFQRNCGSELCERDFPVIVCLSSKIFILAGASESKELPSGRSIGEKKLLTKHKWILLDIPKPWKTALFSQWHRQPNKKNLSSPNRDHKYDYLVTRPAYSYRTEKSARLLAGNDINMELRRVASHYSGNEPLQALLPLLPLAKEQARTLECLLWCLTASYLNYENTNKPDHQWGELRDYSLLIWQGVG